MEQLNTLWLSTGLYQLSVGQFVMILVGLVLLFLAIRKNFEPLLLIPICLLYTSPSPRDRG